ncbi:hypothetical protein ACMV8I_16720 [Ewingella sp. S1.OA.A_B6]
MYYNDQVISYLQANRILALKLDHALTAVRRQVADQLKTLGAGAQRLTYYTSCFTDDYQDVCQQQKTEDIRFRNAVIHLLRHGGVVFDMLKIYFEEIFKYKTSAQLERIKKMLMAVNIHIAASYLTTAGFALAVASVVAVGMNLSLNMSALIGGRTAGFLAGVGTYGIVQKAADSAHRLYYTYPAYYAALYAQELEMMFFLVESLFERAGAFKQSTSDGGIADIITKMIR